MSPGAKPEPASAYDHPRSASTPADPIEERPSALRAVREMEAFEALWMELRALRRQLAGSEAERSRLQEDLDATEKALEYTKGEVANLWRLMTTRNHGITSDGPAFDRGEKKLVRRLSGERARIQAKITDVRTLARRRRWPWSLVG